MTTSTCVALELHATTPNNVSLTLTSRRSYVPSSAVSTDDVLEASRIADSTVPDGGYG